MFKTDKASLEKLSFAFNEQDISRISRLLELLKLGSLSNLSQEEINRLQKGLYEIGKLKLEGKIYVFEVDDSYARKQGGNAGEGVELYRRQGDTLKDFCINSDRDWVLKVDQTLELLKKRKINTLYTGEIDSTGGFLGLQRESDPEDPISRTKLGEIYISEYAEAGINVITLDKLI